jgi:hypothetical protein
VLQYAIYKTFAAFMQKLKAQQRSTGAVFRDVVIDFIMNVFDRIHGMVPQFKLKELAIGLTCSRQYLLLPTISKNLEEMGCLTT